MDSRRDRRRQETIDEIKETARSQLAQGGPSAISMRAVARHLGMTASAVHHYFPSHQTLLDALIVDGFASLADTLGATYEELSRSAPSDQWLGVCRAHRAWALAHQAEYLLLYGHDGGDAVKRRHPQILSAFSGVVNVLYSIMSGAVAAGEIDTERVEANTPAVLRKQLAAWRDSTDMLSGLPDGAIAGCMIAYAQLHGSITLELVGHYPPPLADHPELFDLRMVYAYTALRPPSSR